MRYRISYFFLALCLIILPYLQILTLHRLFFPIKLLLLIGGVGFLVNWREIKNIKLDINLIISLMLLVNFILIAWRQSNNLFDYKILISIIFFLNLILNIKSYYRLINILFVSSLIIFISYVIELIYKSIGVVSPIQNTFFINSLNYDVGLDLTSNARPVGVMGKKYLTSAYALLSVIYIYSYCYAYNPIKKNIIIISSFLASLLIQAYTFFIINAIIIKLMFFKNKKTLLLLLMTYLILFLMAMNFFKIQECFYLCDKFFDQIKFIKKDLISIVTVNFLISLSSYYLTIKNDLLMLIFGGNLSGSYNVGGDFGFLDFLYINGLISVILLSIKISSAMKYFIFDGSCTKNFSLIFCYVSIIYLSLSTLHYYIFLDINFLLIFIFVLMLSSDREVNY